METKDKAKFHIVMVQAVVFKNGKALIAQRSFEELQAPGKWSLPGGKVELFGADEDVIEKTLNQEFLEEVGIEIGNFKYIKSGSFVRVDGSSVITICFTADWKSGDAEALEDSIAVEWIKKEDIEKFDFAVGVKSLVLLGFEMV